MLVADIFFLASLNRHIGMSEHVQLSREAPHRAAASFPLTAPPRHRDFGPSTAKSARRLAVHHDLRC